MNRLVIIDGNAIVHRAYHALPPMTTKDGKMVNAVYGFTSMLLRVWKDLKPTHIAVTFDMAGPTFRHVKFEDYKATRVKADQELYDQIPLVHDVVRALDIPIYEKSGFEADDVIGTIAEKVKKDAEVYIVTGDKDALQLVDDKVKVYTLRKGINDTVIYDVAGVKEKFGFGPDKMIDYKSLAGDSSDNIPGVPGVGEKTATMLIQKVGGIDEIYKKIKKLKELGFKDGAINKLVDGEKSARMSYELATIDCAVPDLDFKFDDCVLKEIDRDKVAKLFQELEFVSLLKRLPGASEDRDPDLRRDDKVKKGIKTKFKFIELKTVGEVKELVEKIKKEKTFACRESISGRDVYNAELFGLAIVCKGESYWLAPELLKNLVPIFENSEIELVGHDLKQLVKVLAVCHPEFSSGSHDNQKNREILKQVQDDSVGGVAIKNKLFDVMIASYLLNPGSRSHDVASIILKTLGEAPEQGAGQNSLFGVDKPAMARELVKLNLAVDRLKADLTAIDDLGLMEKMEMPLLPVLAQIELNGIAVDLDLLKKLSVEVTGEIKKVSNKIFKMTGSEFNISSPTQLREVLFEKMDIPVQGIKKGKTGLSTSAEQLEKLRGQHPIIKEIESYRELEKLRNTYIDVLPTLVNKKTNRIHTTFNQAVTATGRLSSSEPNLQNIPIRTELGREIRKAFVAEPGNLLMSADYSQIELRVVASLSQDKNMMKIFERGEDIHTATAAAIQGVKISDVTREMRRAAKEVNFGILYGMGAYGLAWRAEISQWQAKEFIEKYFNEFSGVKKYLDSTLEFTRKEGYCETLFGRRRYVPELLAGNHGLRAAAERMAINHPIQGTAADFIKMAMVAINLEPLVHSSENEFVDCHSDRPSQGAEESLKVENHASNSIKGSLGYARDDSECAVRMILQVHDELVFEVKKELAEEVGKKVKEIMEGVVKLRVPVLVDVKIGDNWGEMK